MTPTDYAMQLLINGYVAVPDLIVGDELEQMRADYENRAAQLGKRGMNWEEICTDPPMMRWYGHPNVLEIIKAYCGYFGQVPAIMPIGTYGDSYNPDPNEQTPIDPDAVRRGEYELHLDPWWMKQTPHIAFITAAGCLFYLDDTQADSGAYLAARGSHVLTYPNEKGIPVFPTWEQVKQHCRIEPVPVTAGTGIFQLAFHWHAGSGAWRNHRRMCRFNFLARDYMYLQAPEINAEMGSCGGRVGPWTQAERALARPEAIPYLPPPPPPGVAA